jgi:hypothetical protein
MFSFIFFIGVQNFEPLLLNPQYNNRLMDALFHNKSDLKGQNLNYFSP